MFTLAESVPLVGTSSDIASDGNDVVAGFEDVMVETVAAGALEFLLNITLSFLTWGAWAWGGAFAFIRVDFILIEWSLVVRFVIVDDTADTACLSLVGEGGFNRPRVVSWVKVDGNLRVS
jgi:hypothetical protein